MLNKIKKIIISSKFMKKIVYGTYHKIKSGLLYKSTRKKIIKMTKIDRPKIFYLGIPVHTNLGDLAQGVCIRRWLGKHYPERVVVEIETNAIVNTSKSVLKYIKKYYREQDFIVFQSGYTTTDLGGYADEMHREIMQTLPNGKMLMLPQTVFFKDPKNAERTSKCYNSIKDLLFLARDRVSYEMARKMFPDISVKLFPDIVTTLIGNYSFSYKREGILFCCRNDEEKYYSNDEISSLIDNCRTICSVNKTDTTKNGHTTEIIANAKQYIENEIDFYAHYRLIITDRYHGTILSLVAGTPVIIIKTTDHKVVTGAEWFKGVYDEYVYLADNLDHAFILAKKILKKPLANRLKPYFEKEYYDKLPDYFENMGE